MPKPIATLSVSFELGAEDIAYFRDRLARARASVEGSGEAQVIGRARQLAATVSSDKVPTFVQVSFGKLKTLIEMLEDQEWRLEGEDRSRVLDALAYFAEPDDMIPDSIPGIGYLDDAIMIELVARELIPEFEAYADFVTFRQSRSGDVDALANQREQLQRRMRRRGRRMRSSGGGGSRKSPLSLW
jgi:uncharacterized membrane protein YkvA (DUF1232 family)